MDCDQTGFDNILESTSIPRLRGHSPPFTYVCLRPGCTVDKGGDNVRIMPDHTELAPGGAYGPVLDHNALVRFGLS